MKSEPKAFASLSSGLLARKGAARPAMRPQGFGQMGSGLEDLGWNDMGFEAPRPVLTSVGEGDETVPQISRNPLAGLTPASPVHHQQAEIEERFNSFDSDEGEGEEFEAGMEMYVSPAAEAPVYAEDPVEEEDEPLELSEDDAFDLDEVHGETMPSPALILPVMAGPSAAAEFEPEPEAEPELEPIPAPAPTTRRQGRPRSEALAKGKAAFTLRLDPSRHLKLRLACAVEARSAQQLVTKALDELLSSMPELEAMAERAPSERVSRKG